MGVFILDIVVLTIFVIGTGGGKNSPFQPIYFLLPTLAIFLHAPVGRVVTYLVLVCVAFSISMLSDVDVNRDEEWPGVYWFVSLASFILGTTIGLITRQQ